MEITINNTTYSLWYSMRIYLLWEESKGRSMANEDLTSFSTLVDLFYFTVLNTWKHNKDRLEISYDEFLDWVDENGSITIVNMFGFWFAGQIKNSTEIVSMLNKPKEQQENTDEDNSKKKNS